MRMSVGDNSVSDTGVKFDYFSPTEICIKISHLIPGVGNSANYNLNGFFHFLKED